MSKHFKLGKEVLVQRPRGDENNIYFDGWAIKKAGNEYFLTYISSEHGGGERELVIDKKTFNNAKSGKIGLLEIIKNLQST